MSPELVAALMLTLTALAFTVGQLIERGKRLKELQTLLAQTHLEKRAFENQLLVRQGSPPIFSEGGIVNLEHIPSDVSANQILRPPFAQAELDWENEEQKPLNAVQTLGAFVPELSEEEKAAMLTKYQN